ncbi:TonB-dependent siderophore receptor [Gluconobacter sp. Dm-62]|nr:TonB-dependent siderophore receptor [Gluconobacter sp. Dm-62]
MQTGTNPASCSRPGTGFRKTLYAIALLSGGWEEAVAQSVPPDLTAAKYEQGKASAKKKPASSASRPDDSLPGSVEQLLVHGHRPTASTDGSGTYTVSAVSTTRMLLRPEDVPQSISVLSTQQMKDQNLFTVDNALKQVAGVNVNLYGDGTAGFTSRGFQLAAQYDGSPATGGLQLGQQFDLSIYDRIEVLRGPDGVLQGSSAPGGSVNFVHKRPTETFQGNASFSAGSWNNYHATVDLGGPIGNSKIVSARLVMSGTDRDSFYKNAYDRRWTIYGVTGIHIDRRTTLTVSVTSQSNDTTRYMGVPRLAGTGADLNLPRNTFIGSDWNKSQVPTTEVMGQLERRFGMGWVGRVTGRHRTADTNLQYSYINAYTAAAQTANYVAARSIYSETNDGVDGYLTGPLHLLNRTHTLMIGANYNRYVYEGGGASVNSRTNAALAGLPISDYGAISNAILPSIKSRSWEPTEQWGVYGQGRFQLMPSIFLTLGGRISGYVQKSRDLVPGAVTETSINQQGILTPYAALVYHVLPHITLYASYTDTFSPQSAYGVDGHQLQPVRGGQLEGGMKGALFNQMLSFTMAGYRIIQRNDAIANSDLDPTCGPSHADTCYVAAGKTRSQGAEVEVIGRPLPGWDINASYTYNDNRIVDNGTPTSAGLAYAANSPRHLWKLWTHYRFEPYKGAQKNIWSIGGGINAQSSTFGSNRLVTQPGYITASAQVGYQWNRYLALTMNLNNISNTRYYQRLGNFYYYNYYGEPRNFMFTLRSNF